MNMQRDWVCVGDSTGKLHLLDLKNDFELVKAYSTEHTKEITGVHMTDGCLITGSADRVVRISSLTDPPQTIAEIFSKFGKISRVSITRIYRKKNDFDEIFENLARYRSKRLLFIIKIRRNSFVEVII